MLGTPYPVLGAAADLRDRYGVRSWSSCTYILRCIFECFQSIAIRTGLANLGGKPLLTLLFLFPTSTSTFHLNLDHPPASWFHGGPAIIRGFSTIATRRLLAN